MTVDFMTTSYVLNIILSDKFTTQFIFKISNFYKVIQRTYYHSSFQTWWHSCLYYL